MDNSSISKNNYHVVLYANIDQTLPNNFHGPTHCKIGVTCVYNGYVSYTLSKVLTTRNKDMLLMWYFQDCVERK